MMFKWEGKLKTHKEREKGNRRKVADVTKVLVESGDFFFGTGRRKNGKRVCF